MKAWSDDHPKAKLMAKKRAAILDAARATFLSVGYEGASMEAIAAGAGVSIMTLYRHAESKDDLFTAVILAACDYSHEIDHPDTIAMKELPIKDLLTKVGRLYQEKLTSPQIIALFRTVMMETARFPHLGEAAYRGLVEAWESNMDVILSQREEFGSIDREARRNLIGTFFGNLLGTEILRVLLGLHGGSQEDRERRCDATVETLTSALAVLRSQSSVDGI